MWFASFVVRLAGASVLLLFATRCTTASTPPTGHPRPTAAPSASAVPAAPREAKCPQGVPGPYPPLSRSFHQIALPADVAFVQLVGWDNRAWLLSGERLFVHDGNTFISEVHLCPGAVPTGGRSYSVEVGLSGLFAVGMDVRRDFVLARVAKDGSVSCQNVPRLPAGDLQLTLALWPEPGALPPATRPHLGPSIPSPEAGWGVGRFFSTSGSSAWLQMVELRGQRKRNFRFDGQRWALASDVPFGLANDMWEDPTGVTWAIPERGPRLAGLNPGWVYSSCLAKYDGKTWSLVPAAGENWFQPHWLTGTAADDMWFVGRNIVLEWDGRQWRLESFQEDLERRTRVGASFDSRPFMDESGSLWLLRRDHGDGKQRLYRTDPKPPNAPRGKPPG